MNGLPPPILMHILGYTRAGSLQVLRLVCPSFRELLDDSGNLVWRSILEDYCKPLVPKRMLWGKSLGTTALMVKASVVGKSCLSCRLWFNLNTNRLYDIILCGRCSKKFVFRVVNLRKACFNYFLEYGSQKNNDLLVKVPKGRSYSVLLSHVRMTAESTYPGGELQEKMNQRFERSFKTELKKQREKERRVRDISYKFCDVLWEAPSRVDPVLRNQEVLKGLVHSFGSSDEVFGDTLEHRVKACTKTDVVAKCLYDYAAMLTYMRKLHLLDFKYDVTPGHHCTPRNIFRHHLNDGLHFYELCREHYDAKSELAARFLEVETYLLKAPLDQPRRKALAVAMCAEESIDYAIQDFEGFVVGQKGNPVEISRRVREREFLEHNHLAWGVVSFLASGHDQETAQRLAKINVLHRTKGYPPMRRVCMINLSNPS